MNTYTPQTINDPARSGKLYYCSYWIEYADHSSMGGSYDTYTETRQHFHKDVQYYRDLKYPIRQAQLLSLCTKCDGAGKVEIRTKRTPKFAHGKVIICPACKGTDSAWLLELITDKPIYVNLDGTFSEVPVFDFSYITASPIVPGFGIDPAKLAAFAQTFGIKIGPRYQPVPDHQTFDNPTPPWIVWDCRDETQVAVWACDGTKEQAQRICDMLNTQEAHDES